MRSRGLVLFPAVVCAGLGWAGYFAAAAAVIQVPFDQATIQAGIDAATPGDTVLVAPGTYVENVNFRGKDIIVASHFLLDPDYHHVRATVIDGSQPTDPDTASCVIFCSGETGNARLTGFTLTGGGGTAWVDPQYPDYTWRGGGGVFSFQASPTIAGNLITENAVVNGGTVDGAQGGGITCYGGDPLICNNTVRANQADYGAGIVIDYSGARVHNNLVCENTGGLVYGGGGFWTIGSGPAPIVITNNTIVANDSQTRGGAVYVWSSTVNLRNNIIWANSQSIGGPIATVGGGIALVEYCDVEGGFSGTGNLDLDPDFGDAYSFVLNAASPCVDAGDPDPIYNDPEDPNVPGDALWPAQGGLRNDMGVYGGPGCSAFEPGAAAIEPSPGSHHEDRGSLSPYPNPLRGPVWIPFERCAAAAVECAIYDVTGALVRRWSTAGLRSGLRLWRWDGCDAWGRPVPGGSYHYRVAAGGQTVTGGLTVMR